MENIQIRRVTLNDIQTLQKISRDTFSETFSENNDVENMNKYLEEGFATDKLSQEVSNPASQFYFAILDDQVIGYLKLNTGNAQTEGEAEQALEIERIYVLSAYHGKKVGQLLYAKAMQLADELKSNYVWLGVWEENTRAIRFYEKNGFVAFDKHIFKLGEDEQTDIMMKKTLAKN
jgi:ribosomal protein S18 acetylase RimI-like enzyme